MTDQATAGDPLLSTAEAESPRIAPRAAWPETARAAFAITENDSEAQAWTSQLTRRHYENFSVVSALLPRHLRQDFCNVYAFCRVADDLGDELQDRGASLEALAEFRRQLGAAFAGRANTVVFTALRQTITRHDIPIEPFSDLISAFEQDQRVQRYDSFEQVVDYCRRSADPVGRMVLYMCGYRDARRQQLSDKTCTALQLVNFWQDVRRDILERDRIYIPGQDMRRFGVLEDHLRRGEVTSGYRELIRFEVERTERLFDDGEALLELLAPEYRGQIALFGKGGRAICDAIRRQRFDTLSRRPSLSGWQKARLIATTMFSRLAGGWRGSAGGGQA